MKDSVVYYDGPCGLCQGVVKFLKTIDHSQKLHYQPLNDAGETVIFIHQGKRYTHSRAILEIFRLLGFPWKLLWLLILIPYPIRDACYRIIARNRGLFKP